MVLDVRLAAATSRPITCKEKRGAFAPLFKPSVGTPFLRYTNVHLVWGDWQWAYAIALSDRTRCSMIVTTRPSIIPFATETR